MKKMSFLIIAVSIAIAGTPAVGKGSECGCDLSPNAMDALAVIQRYNAHQSESICSEDPLKLHDLLGNSAKFNSSNLKFINAATKSDVIIAGEIHLYTNLDARLALIQAFKDLKGANSCVAFEWPDRAGGLTDTLSDLRGMAAKDRVIGGRNLIRAENIDRMVGYYSPMNDFAHSLGLRTITVDDKDRMTKELSIDQRNHSMGTNLVSALQVSKCDAVLLFVGKAHVAKGTDSQVSLPEILQTHAVRTTSINIQMTNEIGIPDDAKTWMSCAAPLLSASLIFDSREVPGDPLLFQQDEGGSRWKSFDLTLLLPKSDLAAGRK